MIILGIDPGMDGAVAALADGQILRVHDTPVLTVASGRKKRRELQPSIMREILEGYRDQDQVIAAIEKVHTMPKQGVVSSGRFMFGFGLWIGLLAGLRIPYELVTPQAWKKALMNGMAKEKGASMLRAKALFPNAPLELAKHHGRADAIMIAEHLRRRVGA